MAYPWIETPGQPLQDDPIWTEPDLLDAPPEGSGYTDAEGGQSCATCLHQLGGACHLFGAKVDQGYICNDWAADLIGAGGIIDEEVENPFEQIEMAEGHHVGVVEMQFSSADGEKLLEDDRGLIWKTALRTGEWAMSPGPGAKPVAKPLVVKLRTDAPEREIGLENLVEAFYSPAMDHVTVPLSHADRVDENTGFVRELRVQEDPNNPGQHVLQAGYDFTEPEIKDKVKRGTIANNSVGVLFNYVRKLDGRKFPQALGHIALTNKPWIGGLTPFGMNADEGETEGKEVVYCSEIAAKKKADLAEVNVAGYLRGGKPVKGYSRKFKGAISKMDSPTHAPPSKKFRNGDVAMKSAKSAVHGSAEKAGLKRVGKVGGVTDNWNRVETWRSKHGDVEIDYPSAQYWDKPGGKAMRVRAIPKNGGKDVYRWRADLTDEGQLGEVEDVIRLAADSLKPKKKKFGFLSEDVSPDGLFFSETFAEVEQYLALLGNSGPLPGGTKKKDNWVDAVGGLPRYVREVARELMKNGHPKSRAIAIALSRIKVWAVKSKDPKVKAKAAKAIAEWEAKRARAHAKSLKASERREGNERGEEVNLPEHTDTEDRDLMEIQLAEMASELETLRREKHERTVEKKIDELKARWSDAPALLSEAQDLMLADAGEPVVTLMLSEEGGSPQETGLTVTDVVERLLAVVPDLKTDLSEQHSKRDAGKRPDDEEKELTDQERALNVATYLGDDEYLKTIKKTEA